MPVFTGSSEGEMTVPKPSVFGTSRGVNRPSLSEQVSQNALGESLTEPTEGHARALASQGKGYALTQYGIQSQDDPGTIPGASQPNLLKRKDDPGYPGFGTPLFLYYLLLFRPPPHAIGRVENPGLPGWTLIISHLTRDGPGIILGRTWETETTYRIWSEWSDRSVCSERVPLCWKQPTYTAGADLNGDALLDPATEVALVVADSGTIGPPTQTGDVLPRSNKSIVGIKRGCCVPQEAEPLSL